MIACVSIFVSHDACVEVKVQPMVVSSVFHLNALSPLTSSQFRMFYDGVKVMQLQGDCTLDCGL